MAERAHPDEPEFQDQWNFRLRRGFFPWWTRRKSRYRQAFVWRYNWVNSHCAGKDVIDIPCGMGWGTSLIKGARSLRGFDLNAEAIAEATERYGAIADFYVGDMAKLELPDSSVDVVCCLEGIEHVPLAIGQTFLKEASRVLRSQGSLLISSPYCRTKQHSGNPYHLHEYQPDEIRRHLGEFFFVEASETHEVDIMAVLYLTCRKKR